MSQTLHTSEIENDVSCFAEVDLLQEITQFVLCIFNQSTDVHHVRHRVKEGGFVLVLDKL
jgi:hypothetical protein